MGVENNNTVIATTWDKEEVKRIKNFVNGLADDFWEGLFLFSGGKINGKSTWIKRRMGRE